MSSEHPAGITRREFGIIAGAVGAAWGMGHAKALGAEPVGPPKDADGNIIAGFEDTGKPAAKTSKVWQPFSDRKIRVGIAGFGTCQFGAQFGYQSHPNVKVVAVTDLIPQRRAALAKACRCEKTYPSCEEMIKDKNIDAVYIATDAPSHARLSIMALEHGKHVVCAVPAVWGSLEDAEHLYNAVKKSGMKYMMNETSCFHGALYGWRQRYLAGILGEIVYSEGEYYHLFDKPLTGYNPKTGRVDANGWRKGLPPQWYPTHTNAYHIGVTGGSFTEVSCMAKPSIVPHLRPENNDYKNPFGTEVALFRTSEGGMSRMVVSWDARGAAGERGRVMGQKYDNKPVDTSRPALPPGMKAGPHGGSHGHLTTEFIDSILRDRKPWIDIAMSLNMTVAGIVAHQSALKDGELLKIPQYAI
jgi:hypothetical protein